MRGSQPCRHGTGLSEHCWQCDIDAQRDAVAAAVKAERERVLTAFDGIAWQFGKAGRKRLEDFIQRIREEAGK